MSSTSSACIMIGGTIAESDLAKFVEPLLERRVGKNFGHYFDDPYELAEYLRAAQAKNEPACFFESEAKSGKFPLIEEACRACGLSYARSTDPPTNGRKSKSAATYLTQRRYFRLRGEDLNPRPSGYEPGSTRGTLAISQKSELSDRLRSALRSRLETRACGVPLINGSRVSGGFRSVTLRRRAVRIDGCQGANSRRVTASRTKRKKDRGMMHLVL
jgi:hypothetical protein